MVKGMGALLPADEGLWDAGSEEQIKKGWSQLHHAFKTLFSHFNSCGEYWELYCVKGAVNKLQFAWMVKWFNSAFSVWCGCD